MADRRLKILCKFPSRSRPEKFKQVFSLYKSMASGKHDLIFVLSFDSDDESMNNDDMKRWLSEQGSNVHWFYGNSTSKISAVNADMDRGWDFDILLLASDDMIPVKSGYDDTIAKDMLEHFPDFDGVLHYNDGLRGDKLNTLCILGKPYFDRFGYIYHPSYISVFADNEFTEVSYALGKARYIDKVIIQHRWMEQGKDVLYQRNESQMLYQKDNMVYCLRKSRGFPYFQRN
jgi:hypothetical protein